MDVNKSQAATKPRFRRTGIIIRIVLLSIVAIFLVWRINHYLVGEARLKSLQEAGHPITLAELQKRYYAPIGEESNAAIFFNRAIALSSITNQISQKLFKEIWPNSKFLSSTQLFSAEYREKTAQLLNENRESLDYLHKSPPGSQSRFALELLSSSFYHVVSLNSRTL